MVERVRGYPLLAGLRGEPAVDVSFIEECLLRLSQLVTDFESELGELDLNPLIIKGKPGDSYIVDARIILSKSPAD